MQTGGARTRYAYQIIVLIYMWPELVPFLLWRQTKPALWPGFLLPQKNPTVCIYLSLYVAHI